MSKTYRSRIGIKSKGFGVLGWLLMIPGAIIVLLILTVGFFEGRKAYWDSKVKEMCEKDGGVTVYERVELSEDDYKKLGGVRGVIPVPEEKSANVAPYFARTSVMKMSDGNPEVTKRVTEIIRRSDEKILGKNLIYSRIGGDFPTGIGHQTYFTCKDVSTIKIDVEKQIFFVRETSK